jgi:hypothetical protein
VPSKEESTLMGEFEWKPDVALMPAERPAWSACCILETVHVLRYV